MNNVQYHPKMQIIVELIHILYDLPECEAGGCCHIVTDDDNIDDDDLKWVIEYCQKDDNDHIDKELSKTICELLLQLTPEQRICLFYLFNAGMLNDGIDKEWWEHLIKFFKSTDEMLSDWNDDYGRQ